MRPDSSDADSLTLASPLALTTTADGAVAPARVVSLAEKRRSARLVWIAAAAAAAVGYGVANRADIVAEWNKPARAEELRNEAFAACGESRWAECREKLDEAKALEPAGEEQQRVKDARRAIERGERGP